MYGDKAELVYLNRGSLLMQPEMRRRTSTPASWSTYAAFCDISNCAKPINATAHIRRGPRARLSMSVTMFVRTDMPFESMPKLFPIVSFAVILVGIPSISVPF